MHVCVLRMIVQKHSQDDWGGECWFVSHCIYVCHGRRLERPARRIVGIARRRQIGSQKCRGLFWLAVVPTSHLGQHVRMWAFPGGNQSLYDSICLSQTLEHCQYVSLQAMFQVP
jgi:hypothetical protein